MQCVIDFLFDRQRLLSTLARKRCSPVDFTNHLFHIFIDFYRFFQVNSNETRNLIFNDLGKHSSKTTIHNFSVEERSNRLFFYSRGEWVCSIEFHHCFKYRTILLIATQNTAFDIFVHSDDAAKILNALRL